MPDRVHFVDVPPPDVVWLRMSGQGEISPGRRVAAGEIVAGVEGTSGCAVAPLAGEVGAVRTMRQTSGREIRAVAVAVDDDAESLPTPRREPARIAHLSREDLIEWIARLHSHGIRVDRHNSPDLAAQLEAATHRPMDAVVCHAIEADPFLPLQSQWLLRHLEAAREGMRLLGRLTGARRLVLAVPESEERRVVRHLRRLGAGRTEPATAKGAAVAAGEALGVRVVALGRTYPQADPTLLAWTLLGRRLPPGRLPTDAGVVMLDAVAAVAVGEAALGWGVCRRVPLGVRDHRGEVAVLAEVWRGSCVSDVLKQLDMLPAGVGEQSDVLSLRAGDFLRRRQIDADALIDGGELILHVTTPPPLADSEPCIRCGWCLDICPTRVHPAGLLEAAQQSAEPRQAAGAPRLARRYGAAACIECGLCEYVCPSRLHLLDAARLAKRLLEQPAGES